VMEMSKTAKEPHRKTRIELQNEVKTVQQGRIQVQAAMQKTKPVDPRCNELDQMGTIKVDLHDLMQTGGRQFWQGRWQFG